jgi:DNA-binding NarL/FixJ family response regulator
VYDRTSSPGPTRQRCAPEHRATLVLPEAAPRTPLTLRVFIVDDSPDIVNGLTELLSADGRCKVVGTAASEQLALDWSFANEAGFDVAVLDLLLREGSGFTVLAHLTKYQPGKVVVLSEYVTPQMAEKCKAFGAVAAFPKSKISDCIRYILDMPRA